LDARPYRNVTSGEREDAKAVRATDYWPSSALARGRTGVIELARRAILKR
jgi:hypothetical protein